MKKSIMTACFFMAAAIIYTAGPAQASQLTVPGAAPNINNTGPGINNPLPGNTVPGALPGNNVPGGMPGNAVQRGFPGNPAPGAIQGNTVPGALPNNNVPGIMPGNAVPGTLPGNTAPGVLPGNTVPGALPGNAVQGAMPGAGAPGVAAPGTQTIPGRQPGLTAPGMQPGLTAPGNYPPGIINPNSPYNNGTNLPGTSTTNRQVGGVTNDPNNQEGYRQDTAGSQYKDNSINPVTGRTRPLLKATPIPGEIDVYNVHLHDTLWIISQKYRIRLDAVIDANPELQDPDLIYPGDQIKVPLNPKSYEMMDIADSNLDKGDGNTKIRSNIIQGRYSGVTQQTQGNPEEKELLDLVNNERAKAGLPSVKLSAALGAAARIKADEMCAKKYFNHTSPIYGTPFEMLHAFGISYRTAGENIAKGQKTANAVMGAWMNSEGHRANILNKDFTEVGVGYANDGKITYWAQIFIGK